ncbi:hypothetical protein Hdeb2414_s0029g00704961 [Helianthus debilis subsp. tardiflorus]
MEIFIIESLNGEFFPSILVVNDSHLLSQLPISLPTPKIIIIIFIEQINRSSSSSSSNIFIIEHLHHRIDQRVDSGMAADAKIRKTPTTKARTLDNLLEDGAVHIRK